MESKIQYKSTYLQDKNRLTDIKSGCLEEGVEEEKNGSLKFGDLSLDTAKATLTCNSTGQSVRLGEKELHILEYMFGNHGQIMTREQLAVKI